MIKENLDKKKLIVVRDILDEIYETGNIKKYKLTVCDVHGIEYCCKEILKHGSVITIGENISHFFQKYGFSVNEDVIGWKISL